MICEWQYKVLYVSCQELEKITNVWGKKYWEVISILPEEKGSHTVVMKRPVYNTMRQKLDDIAP